ncbi:porin family protein [Myxococcota bacterium]|nr:porin family protein [Myxococcota bacterium]MBU1382207.1 porin family protein [Myxococcota bacterium]MBU1499029.1 porin family protein [Myxococcota bacterium]
MHKFIVILAFICGIIHLPQVANAFSPQFLVTGSAGSGSCTGNTCNVSPLSFRGGLSAFYLYKNAAFGISGTFGEYYPQNGSMGTVSASVEGRYYLNLSKKLQLHGDIGAGYSKLKIHDDQIDADWSTTGTFVAIGLGIAYLFTPQFSVGLDVKYHLNFWNEKDTDFNEWYSTLGVAWRF